MSLFFQIHPEICNAKRDLRYSSMPSDDPLWSRYTLLVYLNDDIPKGTGCTTFFLPAPNEMGVMEAMSVRPIQGAVLCFRKSRVIARMFDSY